MLEPVEAADLNIYGDAELPWSRVLAGLPELARPETPQFLGTVGPDGRPHSTGIGCIVHDDAIFFTSGPKTRKSRNLAANPACTLSFRLPDVDLVLEGEAQRVTDPAVLTRVAALYREHGWPAQQAGDASPPPTAPRAPAHHPGTCTASPRTRPSA